MCGGGVMIERSLSIGDYVQAALSYAYLNDLAVVDLLTASGLDDDDVQSAVVGAASFIQARSDQNESMRAAGWLVYNFGELYSRRIGEAVELFVFRESEIYFTATFILWGKRTHATGGEQTFKRRERDLLEGASFQSMTTYLAKYLRRRGIVDGDRGAAAAG